jgi:hypothetical protein
MRARVIELLARPLEVAVVRESCISYSSRCSTARRGSHRRGTAGGAAGPRLQSLRCVRRVHYWHVVLVVSISYSRTSNSRATDPQNAQRWQLPILTTRLSARGDALPRRTALPCADERLADLEAIPALRSDHLVRDLNECAVDCADEKGVSAGASGSCKEGRTRGGECRKYSRVGDAEDRMYSAENELLKARRRNVHTRRGFPPRLHSSPALVALAALQRPNATFELLVSPSGANTRTTAKMGPKKFIEKTRRTPPPMPSKLKKRREPQYFRPDSRFGDFKTIQDADSRHA